MSSKQPKIDIPSLCNGIIAGLISVTSNCDCLENFAAVIIGSISGVLYLLFGRLIQKFKVDDPLESFCVNGISGFWSVMATGLFDNKKGVFWGATGSGNYMGWQVVGAVVISAWASMWSFGYFWICKKRCWLRLGRCEEVLGLSFFMRGGSLGDD